MKNNKGYLLAETLIAITVIATIITIIYATTINYYVKTDNYTTRYNTPQGLQTTYQIKKLCSSLEDKNFIDMLETKDYISVDIDSKINNELNISNIYYSKKDLTSLIENESIPRRIKKNLKNINDNLSKDNCDYKYIIIFNDGRYSIVGSHCGE